MILTFIRFLSFFFLVLHVEAILIPKHILKFVFCHTENPWRLVIYKMYIFFLLVVPTPANNKS